MIRHTRGERRLRSGPPRAARRSPGRCCQSTRGRFQAQCAHDKEVRSNACAIRRSPDARPSRTTTRVIAIDFWSDYLPWALSCRTQTSIERPPTSQDKASTSHDLAAPRRHFYPLRASTGAGHQLQFHAVRRGRIGSPPNHGCHLSHFGHSQHGRCDAQAHPLCSTQGNRPRPEVPFGTRRQCE